MRDLSAPLRPRLLSRCVVQPDCTAPAVLLLLLVLSAFSSGLSAQTSAPVGALHDNTLSGNALPGVFATLSVPPALEPWQEWAVYGKPDPRCPRSWENQVDYRQSPPVSRLQITAVCAWPGELSLDVRSDGAYFTAHWQLYQATTVTLPGDDDHWPVDVRTETQTPAVTRDTHGNPVIYLEAGEHRISGRIPWLQRPESLSVPAAGLIRLRRDGVVVSPIDFDESDKLWLGTSLREKEQNEITVDVARLIQDGLPETMRSFISLSISGEPREIVLGPVLLPGHALLGLESELPAKMDQDGRLTIQVRSGYWDITVHSRTPLNHSAYTVPAVAEPWPQQEYWGVIPDYSYRSLQLSGGQLIDANQTALPNSFYAANGDDYPLRVLHVGESLQLEELHRGAQSIPDQITLKREAWLDYDGRLMRYRDELSGTINRTSRLNVQAPFSLDLAVVSAYSVSEKTLITYAPETGGAHGERSGIEWRNKEVELSAQLHTPLQQELPLTAWDQPLEFLSMNLNLPAGYQLIYASAFDYAESSWIARWNLLSLFLSILCVALLWQIGRWSLLVPGLILVTLAHQQPAAPLFSVLVVSGLVLLLRWSPGEKARFWLQRLLLLAWIVLGLQYLWFSSVQLQSTVHPSLEPRDADSSYRLGFAKELAFEAPAPASPRVQARQSAATDEEYAELDRVEVTGSRLSNADLLTPYDPDAQRQAGQGQPNWRWHQHLLERQGPIDPDEQYRLLISPPWLTRLLRLLMVCAGLFLLWGLAKHTRRQHSQQTASSSTASGLSLLALSLSCLSAGLALPATPLYAQDLPSTEVLEQLAARLQPAPDCLPECISIPQMQLFADQQELRFEGEIHSAILGIAGLPRPLEVRQQLDLTVTLDGAAVPMNDEYQIALTPGRHTLVLRIANPGFSEWKLSFPLIPKHLTTELHGWDISGLQGDRPQNRDIALYRSVSTSASDSASDSNANNLSVQPYIQVTRTFLLDLDPYVRIEIKRLDLGKGSAQFRLPLLDGEQFVGPPSDELISVELNDNIQSFSLAGGDFISWHNNLSRQAHFEWSPGDSDDHAEDWVILSSAVLHVEFAGAPVQFGPVQYDSFLQYSLRPRSGETLFVDIQRPQAVPGATQALDQVHLLMRPGRHYADFSLKLQPSITQPGLLPFRLPADAELRSVMLDETVLPLPPVDGVLNLPVNQETEQIALEWRQRLDSQAVLRTPELQLDRPIANLVTQVEWSGQRWLLWTGGPGQGPVIRFWSLLVLLIVTAVVLARLPHSPLKTQHWLVLGLGFSTVNSWAFVWIVAFFFVLAWRQRLTLQHLGRWRAIFLQLALTVAALISVQVLIGTIMDGLLARPDMLVANPLPLYSQGISSYGTLTWFTDSSAGALPSVQVYSAPLWLYRVIMLLWALWLALHSVQWLRWAWSAFSHGGLWGRRKPKTGAAPEQVGAELVSDTVE